MANEPNVRSAAAASVPWWVWIFVQTTNGKTTVTL